DVAFIDPSSLADAAWLIKEIRGDGAIAQTRIILLLSLRDGDHDEAAGMPDEIERLLKPVRQSTLYDSLSATIPAHPPPPPPPPPEKAAANNARIPLGRDQ